jgi:hypothetical protein
MPAHFVQAIPKGWNLQGMVFALEMILNSGDVEAVDVKIDVTLSSAVNALEATPAKPALPRKPSVFVGRGQ